MGILIVRLKTIEYKEDSFCYLSSSRPRLSGCMFSDPIFPAVCLQNFCFFGGTHLFTQTFSDPKSVLQSEPPFAEFLADPQKDQLFLQQVGQPNTREPYSLRPTSGAFFYLHGGSKGLRFHVDRGRFLAITQATDQSWD